MGTIFSEFGIVVIEAISGGERFDFPAADGFIVFEGIFGSIVKRCGGIDDDFEIGRVEDGVFDREAEFLVIEGEVGDIPVVF